MRICSSCSLPNICHPTEKQNGQWSLLKNSPAARRIDMFTPMRFSGPAAGAKRLITDSSCRFGSQDGISCFGTMGNCAGGKTPWGSVLTAEEGFSKYFSADDVAKSEALNAQAFGIAPKAKASLAKVDDRFNFEKYPQAFNHFGWIVEIDPADPKSTPRKLTALGRFQHEGATIVTQDDRPLVVYMGDDGKHEHIYRFVSTENYKPQLSQADKLNLLDDGVLSVAVFDDDFSMKWLPLVYGQGPLNEKNGFYSQADVLIETRRAAKLLGATPMDRPEDVEADPSSGIVYAMLTNNTERTVANQSNPRVNNKTGHIVAMIPPAMAPHKGAQVQDQRDHTGDTFSWNLLIMAGNPKADSQAWFQSQTSQNGWFCCPDNVAFNHPGMLWVATDGCEKFGFADGLWAVQTEGEQIGYAKHFMSCPAGAEACGPEFTPDGETLFLSIQHPGDSHGANFDSPSSRWPLFDAEKPPLPSVVAIQKRKLGKIGS